MPLTYIGVGTGFDDWTRFPADDDDNIINASALTAPDHIDRTASIAAFASVTNKMIVASSFGEVYRSSAAFRFFGKKNTGGTVGQARIWGFSKIVKGGATLYMTDYLCSLVLHLGGSEIPYDTDEVFEDAATFFATEIDITADESLLPGIRVVGRGGGAPQLILDGMGHLGYLVELTNYVADLTPEPDPTAELGFLFRRF